MPKTLKECRAEYDAYRRRRRQPRVELRADTSRLRKAMDRAREKLKVFGQDIGKGRAIDITTRADSRRRLLLPSGKIIDGGPADRVYHEADFSIIRIPKCPKMKPPRGSRP